MNPANIYYLDPDYRKEPPKDVPFCIRCQKPIKNVLTAVRVKMVDDWRVYQCDEKSVTKDDKGTLLIGPDCWKKITEQE